MVIEALGDGGSYEVSEMCGMFLWDFIRLEGESLTYSLINFFGTHL